jgi:hypothetical protein
VRDDGEVPAPLDLLLQLLEQHRGVLLGPRGRLPRVHCLRLLRLLLGLDALHGLILNELLLDRGCRKPRAVEAVVESDHLALLRGAAAAPAAADAANLAV